MSNFSVFDSRQSCIYLFVSSFYQNMQQRVVITALIGDLSVKNEKFYAVRAGLSFTVKHTHIKNLFNSIDLSRFVSSRGYLKTDFSSFHLQGLQAQVQLVEVSLAPLFLMTLVLGALQSWLTNLLIRKLFSVSLIIKDSGAECSDT